MSHLIFQISHSDPNLPKLGYLLAKIMGWKFVSLTAACYLATVSYMYENCMLDLRICQQRKQFDMHDVKQTKQILLLLYQKTLTQDSKLERAPWSARSGNSLEESESICDKRRLVEEYVAHVSRFNALTLGWGKRISRCSTLFCALYQPHMNALFFIRR